MEVKLTVHIHCVIMHKAQALQGQNFSGAWAQALVVF